jgi:hypothetical protein
MTEAEMALDTGQADPRLQDTETQRKFRYKSGISKKLTVERVNEVTFKVTDGEMINTPASHGQWPGFRTTRAAAWIIQAAPNEWLARKGDQGAGPMPFSEARAVALAMAKGAAGDYRIEDPISHLHAIAAAAADKLEQEAA